MGTLGITAKLSLMFVAFAALLLAVLGTISHPRFARCWTTPSKEPVKAQTLRPSRANP